MAAQESLLSNGITAVADMGTSAADWSVIRPAGDHGRLRVRILSYSSGLAPLLAVAGPEPTPRPYDSKLQRVGSTQSRDGTLGYRGAWPQQPSHPAPDET